MMRYGPSAAKAIVLGLALASLAAPARAATTTLEKPLSAEVYVKGEGKAARQVKGLLLKFDEAELTMRVGKDEQTMAWVDLTPASAVALRQRTIDRTKADDWLALGEFAWNLGAKEQAQQALRSAVKLEGSLKPQADKITGAPPAPPHRKPTGDDKPAASSQQQDAPQPSKPADTGLLPQPGRDVEDDGGAPAKYTPATPEQAQAANARTRATVEQVTKEIGVDLQEIETDHFLIFTDWDKREFDFLKKNLERAYSVVSRQFEMDPKDNIFVGKLPVYMFSKYADFAKFGRSVDNFPVTNRVAGYYHGNTRGFGHMAMWKPNESLTGSNSIKDAERLWANVLVHEFTHAFLARYRSNVFIPRWLNEGCAEVIAQDVVPLGGRYEIARLMALQGADVMQLFDDRNMPTGEYYPVMQTMVELLVKTNRKGFLKLIDSIKDGEDPETALKKHFNSDYVGFAKEWREYAKRIARN